MTKAELIEAHNSNLLRSVSILGISVPTFAIATAVVVVLAVALVYDKGDWSVRSNATQQEYIPQEILSDSGRLEFFGSLDLLESLATLENMDGSRRESVEVRSL